VTVQTLRQLTIHIELCHLQQNLSVAKVVLHQLPHNSSGTLYANTMCPSTIFRLIAWHKPCALSSPYSGGGKNVTSL
jgi:hypothetical protein